MKKFLKGDRVKLVSNRYGDALNNPVWGGLCGEVEGSITEVTSTGTLIVAWGNGKKNLYSPETLSLILPHDYNTNPNQAFLRRKTNARL